METSIKNSVSPGTYIIKQAKRVNLNPSLLYEAVIDLSAQGLITADCINRAAGILLYDLGLPPYFFENITKDLLTNILSSIAKGLRVKDDSVDLFPWVADIDFSLWENTHAPRVRIATAETRQAMESMLDSQLVGHRREYYYNPEKEYYTYIFWAATILDMPAGKLSGSRFLFDLDRKYDQTPRLTRNRYEMFLETVESEVTPVIEMFPLADTAETRFMFNSDFEKPQMALLRRLFSDHGLTITRAYWEPYRTKAGVPSSICSLYVTGDLSGSLEEVIIDDLRAFLSFRVSEIIRLYVDGRLSFRQMLFAGNAVDFTHMFIYKERGIHGDKEIMDSLENADHKAAFASRVHESNKFTYVSRKIMETVCAHPDLVKFLFKLFDDRFNPAGPCDCDEDKLNSAWTGFEQTLAVRFMDNPLGRDIFSFMFKFICATLKTNFYKPEKRSFAFRMDNRILDPLVFEQFVFGVFYVNGHYASGTHLRADDIARGGLRMIRVTPGNHALELDNAVMLNYALGPKAQRLKHKDICESGSKGVVVPHPLYATYSMQALYDYTDGIMDLMLPDVDVVDLYKKPEMIFFGPDEGTAPLMDKVALRAKDRGYDYWRTITTGKSFGIPHDTYGILDNGDVFGLLAHDEDSTELAVNGKTEIIAPDMEEIWQRIGNRITVSGMTTTSVMGAFRTMIDHYGVQEVDLNLMMTGGPDGDLGANEIQCYKGKICLIIDGGSILFDPDGLDRQALTQIAFMRHTAPRMNSLGFPTEKLGPKGFMVPLKGKDITLPDGTLVADGAVFHRNFLTDPANRKYIEQANIRAFIPCGGFKDTIKRDNVRAFTENFAELRYIVEGANVFFDDAARRFIASSTDIKQIKDSSANKGGVFSSAVAEVLTAFLLEDDYEERLLDHVETRWALIRDIMDLVAGYAQAETSMLIRIHESDSSVPLFVLSEKTSEEIFAFQRVVADHIDVVTGDEDLLWKVLKTYIPKVLAEGMGKDAVLQIMNAEKLTSYRNAIITKKIASMAFYRHGTNWEAYVQKAVGDFAGAMTDFFNDGK
ncbi:NAD-glutamate dehydrogenase domain-containing protein [uncultured Desulfobacter sp.]|uniref:NAD-glutamate dehydrogenase domain-containing protein n=1 Tax=uncultured Desulfobacter sp. TaxID=240139 RepID=UPI0029F4727A|nr:NAD-glutamate dehydrogenase domain-containing protein [uncultured Desulfobacter sp.]